MNCPLSANGSETILTCTIPDVALSEQLEITGKLKFPNEGAYIVKYRACNSAACKSTAYETITINVSAASDEDSSSTETSSTSSEGGSLGLSLFLMMFVQLLRIGQIKAKN
jgi:hypothetical protein